VASASFGESVRAAVVEMAPAGHIEVTERPALAG